MVTFSLLLSLGVLIFLCARVGKKNADVKAEGGKCAVSNDFGI